MVKPLFKKNMLGMVTVFLIFAALISMYTVMIVYMYDPKLSSMLDDFQDVMPQIMAAAGMTGLATTLLEFVNIYLYGFIMLLFPVIFSVILVNQLLTHYVDGGSFGVILATPNSRRRIIVTQLVSLFLGILLLLVFITLLGVISCEALFPGELNIKGYLLLNLGTLLLHWAIAGIIFLFACVFNTSKWYYMFGAGIPVVFFMANALANIGDTLENLKYITIFTLLPAAKIINGDSWLVYGLVLGAIAIVSSLAGAFYFTKKDLSL